MSAIQTCSPCENLSYSNTGNAKTQIQKVAKLIFLVPLFNSAGEEFKLDPATLYDEEARLALINDIDPTQRIYPLNELETIDSTRAENEFKTYASGRKFLVKQGIRSFSAEIPDRTAKFLSQLEGWNCKKFGVYIVDKCNALIGRIGSDGFLYPMEVSETSWNPQYIFGAEDSPTTVNIAFDFAESMRDSDIGMITDATANWLASEGLVDVSVVYSAITTAGYTMTLSTGFGLGTKNVKVTGVKKTDFYDNLLAVTPVASKSYRTNNTPAAITLTSVTEGATGVYVVVLAVAATSADIIRNSISKEGFDFSDVTTSLVTIP